MLKKNQKFVHSKKSYKNQMYLLITLHITQLNLIKTRLSINKSKQTNNDKHIIKKPNHKHNILIFIIKKHHRSIPHWPKTNTKHSN